MTKKPIRWGIIGYGGAFNMGKAHASWINASPGMTTVAVCDLDAARTAEAAEDFPGITTYQDYHELVKDPGVDNVVVILPHNLHYPAAMAAINAGKGVVLEKPMCITTDEATEMIEAAKGKNVLLTVFHNRRHDGDFKAAKRVIDQGLLGDVFRIEAFMGGYSHPGHWWRSNKTISGGCFYDWGAHQIDWVLNFLQGREIQSVTGIFQKRVWTDVTNEDETQAIVRFDDNVVADITISSIARAGKPRWRILGTQGAIVDEWKGSFRVFTDLKGYPAELTVQYDKGTWEQWYPNLAAHLLENAPLEVKPEEARRVIMVIDYAERSAKLGSTLVTPFR